MLGTLLSKSRNLSFFPRNSFLRPAVVYSRFLDFWNFWQLSSCNYSVAIPFFIYALHTSAAFVQDDKKVDFRHFLNSSKLSIVAAKSVQVISPYTSNASDIHTVLHTLWVLGIDRRCNGASLQYIAVIYCSIMKLHQERPNKIVVCYKSSLMGIDYGRFCME
jgi:hypothetical protein